MRHAITKSSGDGGFVKSMLTAEAESPFTVTGMRRSPNCGWRNVTSRMPSGSWRLAIGVSPTLRPSIQDFGPGRRVEVDRAARIEGDGAHFAGFDIDRSRRPIAQLAVDERQLVPARRQHQARFLGRADHLAAFGDFDDEGREDPDPAREDRDVELGGAAGLDTNGPLDRARRRNERDGVASGGDAVERQR